MDGMGRPVYGLNSRLSRPGRHIGVSHSKREQRERERERERAQAGR